MKVKFGGKFFQTKLLSARLSNKVCRLLSSPVLLRKFTNIITLTSYVVCILYLVRVLYIPSPQSAVPIFMLPDLKRFTLRSILLQGYNKSLITSGKSFSLFPLETAQRRHGTLLHYKATAILFAGAPLPVLLCHFFYISPTYSAKRLEEPDMLFHDFG